MSLSAVYQQFLAAPNPEALASDAMLSYVTTLTSFNDSTKIIKHFGNQHKVLRKQSEKVLNAVENQSAVFLEFETTIEFITGGDTYLPDLDDNFLADRIVTFPTLHVVHFDSQGKIKQVRIYWDQGSLLKSIEVIGSRGKNWPIHDGKEQVRLIESSSRDLTGNAISSRKAFESRPAKGPGRSIEPFGAHAVEDPEKTPTFKSPPMASRGPTKQPQRDFSELFVGGESSDATSEGGPPSPTKSEIVAPKSGAGKNYQENRLFENAPDERKENFISPHPQKYSHFEFSDGHDEPAPKPSAPRPKTKHQSNWDFSDFTTPAKVTQRRPQEPRSFALGADDENTPMRAKPSVSQGRRDAETHFELQDDGGPNSEHRRRATGRPRGQGSASMGASLFQNNVIDGNGAADSGAMAKGPRPSSMAYCSKDRAKDFDAHWQMPDESAGPAHGAGWEVPGAAMSAKERQRDFDPHFSMADEREQRQEQEPGLGERSAAENNRPMGEGRSKVVKGMEPNWGSGDASPVAGKENKGINVGGDGMGGKRGAVRGWGFGDEDQPVLQERARGRINRSNQPTEGFWFGDGAR